MAGRVSIIGGGLAGCEAAWQLAKRGVHVVLYEMKPAERSSSTGQVRFSVRLRLLRLTAIK